MPVRSLQTLTSAGATPWIPLDVHGPVQEVQWAVNSGGELSATVQYTLDNVLNAGVSALAITELAFVSADAVVTAGRMAHAATAIRLNVVDTSGAGTVTFRVLQVGPAE